MQTLVFHLPQLEEKILPQGKRKGKVDGKTNDVQSVIIKPSMALTKGFNTKAPLNET